MSGKNLISADTLSRAPLNDTPSADDLQLEKEVQVFVDVVVSSLPATDTRLAEIREAQQTDEKLKHNKLIGWWRATVKQHGHRDTD